jgi:hypothetical protein
MQPSKVELFPVARSRLAPLYICICQHILANVSIRQQTSAYVAYVSIRQHTGSSFQSRAGESLHCIHIYIYTIHNIYVYLRYIYILILERGTLLCRVAIHSVGKLFLPQARGWMKREWQGSSQECRKLRAQSLKY